MQSELKKYKVGIIGNGFVGESTAYAFSPVADIRIYDIDPLRSSHSLEDVCECDFVFIAVPTPMKKDGSQDVSYIEKVFAKVTFGPVYIIKSTILPGTTNNLISKYNNLILLKTFSKSTGLAGLRIGYIICHPKVSKLINSVRPIFDVSHYSLKVAEYFLLNKRIIDQYLQTIKNSKKFVKKECLKRNLKFLNTEANFFHIFLNKKNVSKIYNFLKKNNILVKSKYSRGFKVLENSIRMTYGSRNQMKYFFTKFDKVYNR